MYIDSHAHLSVDPVYEDVDALLARAQEGGIESVVNICIDKQSLERGLKLASKYPWVYNAASTTPHDVEKEGEEVFELMAQAAKSGDLVAVGETGLDYYYTHSAKEIQKDFLRRYLQLAIETELPVVIHCRDAFADFFDILDAEYRDGESWRPGVLHCFTGTRDEAQEVIKRGWYLSLSGIVTFKRSEELREVAKLMPLDRLLIETDTPYLAPQKHRGKQNEPAFLPETALKIADCRGISVEELADATANNARRLFKLKSA